jgi:hypothetical protein
VTARTDGAPAAVDDGRALNRTEERPMFVHTLELADKQQLGRAFEAVLAAGDVSDCAIELDALRIRFTAPEDLAAAVIRALARDGSLRAAAREWVETGTVVASAVGARRGKER